MQYSKTAADTYACFLVLAPDFSLKVWASPQLTTVYLRAGASWPKTQVRLVPHTPTTVTGTVMGMRPTLAQWVEIL